MKKTTPAYGAAPQFLRDALDSDTNDCLLWPYGRGAHGYGRVRLGKFTHNAHRLMCIWSSGNPPTDKHEAAHSCGNRICVNPRHVRWASREENMADKVIHGTDPSGERNGGAKLTANDAQEILESSASGNDLAARFSVSPAIISRIRHRQKWRHLHHGPEINPQEA